MAVQKQKLVTIHWEPESYAPERETFLMGHVTVAAALTAVFSIFIVAGVRFKIEHAPQGV